MSESPVNSKHERVNKLCLCSRLLVASVAFCLMASSGCLAQGSNSETKLSPEKRTQIEAAVGSFMASTHIPGLSVGIVENGEFEWAEGFGFADLENNAPASEHTLFRLGSISKSLTATAAMELWERGQLDLDAPIQKYCPSFPQKPWPISTRLSPDYRTFSFQLQLCVFAPFAVIDPFDGEELSSSLPSRGAAIRNASTCRLTLTNSCSFARNNSITSLMNSFSNDCA